MLRACLKICQTNYIYFDLFTNCYHVTFNRNGKLKLIRTRNSHQRYDWCVKSLDESVLWVISSICQGENRFLLTVAVI